MARIGRPPKAERPPITPDEILDRSAEVFARRGFRGAPLTDIARELGITRAALYIHFDSKHAILHALMERLFARFEQSADAADAEAEAAAAPPRDRLRALLVAHATVVTANLALVDVLTGEEAELRTTADEQLVARVDDYWQRFRAAYRACVDAGVARDVDPAVATHSLIGAVNGVRYWFEPDGNANGPAAAALVADFAIDGVCPGPSGSAG